MFAKINTMNYDALRRICWKLGKLYFNKSILELDASHFKVALAMTNDSLQFLDRFRMCQNKLQEIEMFKIYGYNEKNPYRSLPEYLALVESIH